jgi:hypothetical protein
MGAFMALPVAALIYSFIKNYRHGHEFVYRSAYTDEDQSPPARRRGRGAVTEDRPFRLPVLRRAGAPPRRGGRPSTGEASCGGRPPVSWATASSPWTNQHAGGQPLLFTTGVSQWRRSSLLLL